jgi:hypothetical protein
MTLWKRRVVFQGGGTLDIHLEGEISDPVEFWSGADGALIADMIRMIRQFEKLSPPPVAAKQEDSK